MNALDGLIILGVLLFVALGFRDGVFKKIYGIVGFWVGLIVAAKSMYTVGEGFATGLGLTKEISHIIAFCAIFLIFIVLENLFFRWFGSVEHRTLPVWSRLGGAFIGFFQGMAAVSLLLLMFSMIHLPPDDIREDSSLYESTLYVAPAMFDITTGWIPGSKGFLEELQDNFSAIKLP